MILSCRLIRNGVRSITAAQKLLIEDTTDFKTRIFRVGPTFLPGEYIFEHCATCVVDSMLACDRITIKNLGKTKSQDYTNRC